MSGGTIKGSCTWLRDPQRDVELEHHLTISANPHTFSNHTVSPT